MFTTEAQERTDLKKNDAEKFEGREVLRLPQLVRTLGISRSTIYSKLRLGSKHYDEKFPTARRPGKRSVGWLLSEVQAYIKMLEKNNYLS